MAIRFFHSTSYSTHQQAIDHATTVDTSAIQPLGIKAYVEKHQGIDDFDITHLVEVRKDLAHSVKFYGDKLAKLDPVSFSYLNKYRRIACEEELLYTFYMVSADYQLQRFEGNHHTEKKRLKQLQRCANLLNTLRNTPEPGVKMSPEQGLQDVIDDSPDKPAKYVALTIIAPEIADTMLSLTTAEHVMSLKKNMTDANFYRLNWVWGGGLDRILLDLMPADVGRTQQAKAIFSGIAPVTGYMSWVLYYFRLGLELSLLTRCVIKNSWMDPWATEANKAVKLGIGARFSTQWELRKFNILNDAFWATANMACFFWLVGSGTLGYLGNALTGALLIFDLALVTWGYLEKKTEYKKLMSQYDADIEKLRGVNGVGGDIRAEVDDIKKKVLQEHCNVLVDARKNCKHEWEYAEKQWMHDVWYAVGLFATFSMLCCFFFPPAALLPATALILGIAGAALSFMITIGSHALATSTEIEKLQAEINHDKQALSGLEKQLNQLKSSKKPGTKTEIKELGLTIKHRQDDLAYQKSMVDFHKKRLLQQPLSEALVPATALAILVFMPLGYGLLVLVPTLALLMMSGTLLGLNEPTPPSSPEDKVPARSTVPKV